MESLTFENQPLQLVEHDGRAWLSSADIARALGYSRADKVSQIYRRHSAEFSPSMTCSVENPNLRFSGLTVENRLFSLRGAHLLGMFAHTSKGMKFRRWVLDQLEAIERRDRSNTSLMADWYKASAELDNQNRFASMCGKGLNDHKTTKPRILERVMRIANSLQPSLLAN